MFALDPSNQIAGTYLQVHDRLGTHRFRDVHGGSQRNARPRLWGFGDVLRTNPEHDVLINVIARQRLDLALQRQYYGVCLSVLDKINAVGSLLDLTFDQVHRRATDEAG